MLKILTSAKHGLMGLLGRSRIGVDSGTIWTSFTVLIADPQLNLSIYDTSNLVRCIDPAKIHITIHQIMWIETEESVTN